MNHYDGVVVVVFQFHVRTFQNCVSPLTHYAIPCTQGQKLVRPLFDFNEEIIRSIYDI